MYNPFTEHFWRGFFDVWRYWPAAVVAGLIVGLIVRAVTP